MLEKEITNLKSNIFKLELKNKDIQINTKDKFIENLEETLKNENVRYNALLHQISESNKIY